MRNKLFLVLALLVCVGGASAVTYVEAYNINWTGSQARASTIEEGVAFYMLSDANITQVCKHPSATATFAELWRNGTALLLYTANFSGNCASFPSIQLNSSQAGGYGIQFGHTAAWTSYYWTRGGITNNTITGNVSKIYEGWLNAAGNDYFYNVVNVTFEVTDAPPTLTPFSISANNTFNGTSILIFNATVNGTFYSTTNGTIATGINQTGNLVPITVRSQYYFEDVYANYNTSTNLIAQLDPYRPYTMYDWNTGAFINSFNITSTTCGFESTTTGVLWSDCDPNLVGENIVFRTSTYLDQTYNTLSRPLPNYPAQANIYIYQAAPTFTATEVLTGNAVTGFTVTNAAQINASSPPTLWLNAGAHNVTYSKTNWFSKTSEFSVPALYTGSYSFANVSGYAFNVSFRNNLTNSSVSSFSVTATNGVYSVSGSTSTGSAVLYVADVGGEWNLTVTAPDYAITSQNFSLTSPLLNNVTVYGYTNNSVLVTIRDESTLALIMSNITVTFSGDAGDFPYTAVNGSLFVDNLTDGAYSVKFSASGYSNRSYYITVAESSFQYLTAYLSNQTDEVLFTFIDLNTGIPLANAVTAMARSINGTWVTVQSVVSGVDGRSQLSYVNNVRYRFVTTLEGYETSVIYLDPVLFPTYTVRLIKSQQILNPSDYEGVGIVFSPKKYYDNATNNFSISFANPSGSFVYYWVNVSYPSGSFLLSGTNAYGESFAQSFNISGAALMDNVTVTYGYTLSTVPAKAFRFVYLIEGTYDTGVFIAMGRDDFGMGLFEKVLIASLFVLFVWGIATLYAGSSAGAAAGMLVMGYFAYIGFIPMFAFLVSLLAALALLTWRSSA